MRRLTSGELHQVYGGGQRKDGSKSHSKSHSKSRSKSRSKSHSRSDFKRRY